MSQLQKIHMYGQTTMERYIFQISQYILIIKESYNSAGVWMITCSIVLSFIPLLVYFKNIKDATGETSEVFNQSLSLVPIVK
jgi:hypothetical protein